jgi:3-methyladenine DNA glycosylase AlkD
MSWPGEASVAPDSRALSNDDGWRVISLSISGADLAHEIRAEVLAAADPAKAPGMKAYMKNDFVFAGVVAPDRRAAVRRVLGRHGLSGRLLVEEAWLVEAALTLWAGPEREVQYAAGDVLSVFERSVTVEFLTLVAEPMLATDSLTRGNWWDSVDHLVGCLLSPLGYRFDIGGEMRWWVAGTGSVAGVIDARPAGPFPPELGKIRAGILHQLGRKGSTDEPLLFELCSTRAPDREFFIAKAIGWALRDYSYTAPNAVEAFIKIETQLTPLARREGMKAIDRMKKLVDG